MVIGHAQVEGHNEQQCPTRPAGLGGRAQGGPQHIRPGLQEGGLIARVGAADRGLAERLLHRNGCVHVGDSNAPKPRVVCHRLGIGWRGVGSMGRVRVSALKTLSLVCWGDKYVTAAAAAAAAATAASKPGGTQAMHMHPCALK